MRALAPALLALVALVALVLADHHQRHKRDETDLNSPMPFLMGSRYGRSAPPRIQRTDRFFMSSRYGKRSERAPVGTSAVGAVGAPGPKGPRVVVCEYTGVFPLFRCTRRHRRLPHHKRSSEDESAGVKG